MVKSKGLQMKNKSLRQIVKIGADEHNPFAVEKA